MDKDLRKTLIEHGQYRDVWYIDKNNEAEEKRCLIIPAKIIEPLINQSDIIE